MSDPNAKLATLCKTGHKRIWHTAERCPMCGAIAWGKGQQELAGRWQAKFLTLQALLERMRREMEDGNQQQASNAS